MNYIDMFMPPGKPLVKPRFVAIEESWELLEHVFPEPGFRSYFLGHVVEKLAEELRKNQITNYYDRQRFAHLATIPGLLSNISFAGKETVGDDRRGTHRVHDQGQDGTGDAAGNAELVIRQTKEGEGTGEAQVQARPVSVVMVKCDCCTQQVDIVKAIKVPREEGALNTFNYLCPDCASKL